MTAFCKEVTAKYSKDRVKPAVLVSYIKEKHWYASIVLFSEQSGANRRNVVANANGKTRIEALIKLRERWLAGTGKEVLPPVRRGPSFSSIDDGFFET